MAAGDEVAARTVTVLSASKTFNLAGLKSAACICGSVEIFGRLANLPGALTATTSVAGAVASAGSTTQLRRCCSTTRAASTSSACSKVGSGG
jgi:bifunctional pyridoxal-dependent enzyme with beta-cystathionase and maltose regulon repressor activities